MKVAIVGYGLEGRVSFDYFSKLGHDITICDENPNTETPSGTSSQLGETWDNNLDKFDVIMRTAGLNPNKILKNNPAVAPKITTAVNEFLKNCPTKNIIGITGTKGKGTTSTLTAKMLEKAGKKVWLAGNIGRSPLEFIDEIKAEDYVVLELSSFQLCDVQHAPHTMVCLMVVPEHLDWHGDLDDYLKAKKQVFSKQTSDDIAIYFSENERSREIASVSKGKLIPFFQKPGAYIEKDNVVINGQVICSVKDIRLLGKHNWQNVCASITAVWQFTQDQTACKEVIETFSGLQFRLTKERVVNDVTYYNDSFGTTPETASVAIQAFTKPLVLITGGSDKGVGFDGMADAIANSTVHSVIAIGDTGPKIADLVRQKSDKIAIIEGLENMEEIVNKARDISKPGDVVLLSCGSASFGLFKDYKDRGSQFSQAVAKLASND